MSRRPAGAAEPAGTRSRPLPVALRLSLLVHATMATALLASPSRWRLWASVVFASHVGLAAAAMTPRSSVLGPNLTRLPRRQRRLEEGVDGGGRVAVTFDDGPDPEVTPRILELLERAHAEASFFLIGRRAERHPELVRQILAAGHAVHNHTWSHSSAFAMFPPRLVAREIDRTQAVLRDLGAESRLFRAPAGVRPPWLEPLLARRSLHLVAWSRRGFDAVDRDAERVRERLTRSLADGDILLLHDGRSARRVDPSGAMPAALDALPGLLEELARRDLEPVALHSGLVDEAVAATR